MYSRKLRTIVFFIGLILLLSIMAFNPSLAQSSGCAPPTNISNAAGSHTDQAQIDSGIVVWRGQDGNDFEIFVYDLTVESPTPVNISNSDNSSDSGPQIADHIVVWEGYDGNDPEIFAYDLDAQNPTPVNISDNDTQDYYPKIADGIIVWRNWDGNDWEIFAYDTSDPFAEPINISNNDGLSDYYPDIDNGVIVWEGSDGHDEEVFAYDLNAEIPTIANVTNDDSDGVDFVSISDGIITWLQYDGNDNEVFAFKLDDVFPVPINISDNDINDHNPRSGDGLVVWEANDGNNYEIFAYDFNADSPTAFNLSNRDIVSDTFPRTDSGRVVWIAWEAGFNQIFFYDTTLPYPNLTNVSNFELRASTNPYVEGNTVIWMTDIDGYHDVFATECGNIPEFITPPQSTVIDYNASTTLSFTAQGDGTITYQWYEGKSGDTSQPINGATSNTYITPELKFGVDYWAQLTSEYGVVDSDTATVSILDTMASADLEDSEAFYAEWTTGGQLDGEGIVCGDGTAYRGDCAWVFTGSPTEKTKLKWAQIFSPALRAAESLSLGDRVNFNVYAFGQGSETRLVVKIIAVYTDGTKGKAKLLINQTFGYRYHRHHLDIAKDVERVKAVLVHKSKSGKIYLDDMLFYVAETPTEAIIAEGAEPIALPDAPEGFRK